MSKQFMTEGETEGYQILAHVLHEMAISHVISAELFQKLADCIKNHCTETYKKREETKCP